MSQEQYRPYEQPMNPEFSLPFFGKHFVIAGGTSGIGLETAKQLSKQGASVMVIGSREESGKKALATIKAYSDNPNTTYDFADLSSIQSTMQLALRLRTEKPKIDGFIYCAAPKQNEEKMTGEGIDRDWAVGYFAPHILLHELLANDEHESSFQENAFIGYVSSLASLVGKIDKDKVISRNGKHYASREKAYAAAKRATVIEMRQRQKDTSGNNPEFIIYDPLVANTERVHARAKEVSTKVINAAIRHSGFSPKSTAKHLIQLAQRHFAGEALPFYNVRRFTLPELLLPHPERGEVNDLLQFTDGLVERQKKQA